MNEFNANLKHTEANNDIIHTVKKRRNDDVDDD